MGILALGFIVAKMPPLRSGIRLPIDWLGTALLIVAVVPLLLGLTLDKSTFPWSSPLIIGLFAIAAAGAALFLFVEARVPSPVLPLDLFSNRTVAVVSAASVFLGASFMGAVFFLSLFMVNVVGVSATAAGTTLIPLTFAVVEGAMASSLVVQRVGRYKAVILAGFAFSLVGYLLLARMDASVTRWDVTWRMILLGLGLGPAMPLLNLSVQNASPLGKVGIVTGMRQFAMQMGGAIGLALFGVVLSTVLAAQLRAGMAPLIAQLPAPARQEVQARLASGRLGNPTSQPNLPPQMRGAARDVVRHAFAAAVTRIYAYAAVLMVVATLVLVALPEIPLRGRGASGTTAGPPTAAA